MFLDPRSVAVYVYKWPIDCRKGHAGLLHLVTGQLQHEIRSGAIFLFASKDRKTAKALRFDGSGLVIYHKKMERGRIMTFKADEDLIKASAEEFMGILAGAQIRLDLRL